MISYARAVEYLYGLQTRGVKLGLRNTRLLLAALGNPQTRFPAIHVAGTNGKGSTCAFLASIFAEAGYRTGLYTSPHLVRFTERIRVDGREIPERTLARHAERLRPHIDRLNATFFEATTCIAFQHFADEEVDIAIVETGLGGRLDATNTLQPLASVITTIDLDHREELGDTVREIAREKAGIIKPGVPVVTGVGDGEALQVLRQTARRQRAPFFEARRLVRVAGADRAEFSGGALETGPLKLGLGGPHQRANASLAVAAVQVLLHDPAFARRFRRVGSRAVARGLSRVVANTGLGGRMQLLRAGPTLLDVAHNPAGARALAAALRARGLDGLVVVFGVLADKDVAGMLREIGMVARRIVVVSPRNPRALPAAKLLRKALALGLPAVQGGSVAAGLRRARRLAGTSRTGPPVLVTGSHYVVGEALGELGPGGAGRKKP